LFVHRKSTLLYLAAKSNIAGRSGVRTKLRRQDVIGTLLTANFLQTVQKPEQR
jgi:hypothetical protein